MTKYLRLCLLDIQGDTESNQYKKNAYSFYFKVEIYVSYGKSSNSMVVSL